MTVIRSLLFGIAFYGGTLVLGIVYLPLLLLPSRISRHFYLAWAAYALFCIRWIAGIREDLQLADGARLPTDPAIYAAKHQSAWETLAFNTLIPNPVFVLKRELLKIPFFGWYLGHMRQITVDRGAGASAMRGMMTQAQTAVDEGRSIVIYPQGTRAAPGASIPYHPGVFALYKALNLPVIPIALNSGRLWARNGVIKHPGTVTVRILPAIEPGLDRKTFMARLEAAIETEMQTLA